MARSRWSGQRRRCSVAAPARSLGGSCTYGTLWSLVPCSRGFQNPPFNRRLSLRVGMCPWCRMARRTNTSKSCGLPPSSHRVGSRPRKGGLAGLLLDREVLERSIDGPVEALLGGRQKMSGSVDTGCGLAIPMACAGGADSSYPQGLPESWQPGSGLRRPRVYG
jgi:hypothetical protein